MSTFGLVHGGGFGAWCWERLTPELEKRGHHPATVDLTPEDQEAGAARCAAVVADAFAAIDDLVLVGHSLAGLIIPLVPAERPVRRLVFLHALLPLPGRSVVDQLGAEPDMFNPDMFAAQRPFWEDEDVANRFLLRQMASLLHVAETPSELPIEPSALPLVQFDYLGPRLPDGTTRYFWDFAAETYQRWHAQSRGPLLTFPADVRERGWSALRAAGVPADAWFVALHVREGKWKGSDSGLHGTMNSDIATYLPAVAEIAARGGWVIRMGDPGMRPLPQLPNVIDYCHSDLRADWMDIFIAACCRFMLGSASGPALIPPVFGVPCVLTNWWPPAQRPWHAADIFMPKMLRRSDGRLLALSETLREPFGYCHSRGFLADQGVTVEDNSAELIVEAVTEMLDRLDGHAPADAEAEGFRSRSDQIYRSHGVLGMALHSRGLLRRHREFVG